MSVGRVFDMGAPGVCARRLGGGVERDERNGFALMKTLPQSASGQDLNGTQRQNIA